MITNHWKEAASLIIITRAPLNQRINLSLGENLDSFTRVQTEFKNPHSLANELKNINKLDYRMLMVKRSGLSSFLASAFVFPGGQVELADFSSKWWSVFKSCGQTKDELVNSFNERIQGPRPPIITNPVTLSTANLANDTISNNFLPGNIALRITAIRETFEETGILLLVDSKNNTNCTMTSPNLKENSEELKIWQEKVRKNANTFIDFCIHFKLIPDIWSLYEWWNWLTPASVAHKRFDTMFYICCLNKQPNVVLDNTEVTTLKWCTPLEMLKEHYQEKVFLAPPQAYELSRLYNLKSFNNLIKMVKKRERFGTKQWMPIISTYADGSISILPGDDLYPQNPDLIGNSPLQDYPQSIIDSRMKAINLNRIEIKGSVCLSVCNQKLSCGHLTPISYPPITTVIPSML